jgi:hypothetical protein
MTIDTVKLARIEAMLTEDTLTDEDLTTQLREAGLSELARIVGQLARR